MLAACFECLIFWIIFNCWNIWCFSQVFFPHTTHTFTRVCLLLVCLHTFPYGNNVLHRVRQYVNQKLWLIQTAVLLHLRRVLFKYFNVIRLWMWRFPYNIYYLIYLSDPSIGYMVKHLMSLYIHALLATFRFTLTVLSYNAIPALFSFTFLNLSQPMSSLARKNIS